MEGESVQTTKIFHQSSLRRCLCQTLININTIVWSIWFSLTIYIVIRSNWFPLSPVIITWVIFELTHIWAKFNQTKIVSFPDLENSIHSDRSWIIYTQRWIYWNSAKKEEYIGRKRNSQIQGHMKFLNKLVPPIDICKTLFSKS